MRISKELYDFAKEANGLSINEVKNLQVGVLVELNESMKEISTSLKIMADEYSNALIETVENELLYEIMEKSEIIEDDDGDLVTDKMKEIIIKKLIK
jgi:hypothetical protein